MDDVEDRDDLTPLELARLLELSPRVLGRWAAHGWLPFLVTAAGQRRFRREDVEEIGRLMSGDA